MTDILAGYAAALLGIGWAFRSRWANFWVRMTLATGGLGLYALAVRPKLRQVRPTGRDALAGVLSAAGLYAVFQIGDRVARQVVPKGASEIESIYALRGHAPRWLIALLLAGVIAPGEELFWRGLLQASLAERWGSRRGTVITSACYAAVHLASGNLTLTGAAATAGVFWGVQYALLRRLASNIVSHVLWDIWIFLVAPTPGAHRDPRA